MNIMHVSLYDHYNNRMYKMQGRSLKVLTIIVLLLVEFGMLSFSPLALRVHLVAVGGARRYI